MTQFVYDGDGNLVKKIKPDNSKTIYVGSIYEVDKTSGGSVTRTVTYYPAGGAMRINSTLYYILKDHLGSASVVTDANGNTVGEDRFYPFGETRLTTGIIYTDRLFTGQREITGLGIYHFNARFYSPKLGKFLSPDTIIPSLGNPQSLNRFSYVTNNPLRYTDPTGHMRVEEQGDTRGCSDPKYCQNGKPKPAEELAKMRKPKNSNDGTNPSHKYQISNIVCPAAFACSQAQMTDALSRFAYPGQDSSKPVQDYGTYPVEPFNLSSDPKIQAKGMIQVNIFKGGLETVNRTLPGHIFYNGQVIRTLSQDSDGAWRVTTYGDGTNTNTGIALVNALAGPEIFQEVDDKMKAYITAQYLPGALYVTPEQLIP